MMGSCQVGNDQIASRRADAWCLHDKVSSSRQWALVEEVEDVKVRARLEAAGADEIQWVSILDVHGITPVGTQSCHIMHDSTKVRSIS